MRKTAHEERSVPEIKQSRLTMPMIVLRGVGVFPKMLVTFDVDRKASVSALNNANRHDRMVFLVVRTNIFGIESVGGWKLVVELDCSTLPLATKGINQRELKFWSIESTLSRLDFIFKTGGLTCGSKSGFGMVPCCVITNVVFRTCAELY